MKKPKIILGIETSCDETACAIVQKDGDRVTILSNVVASSADLQSKYGGVIPEQAAREQIKSIIPVIQEALFQAFPNVIPSPARIDTRSVSGRKKGIYNMDPRLCGDDAVEKIDAIAITQGPGLIGSLLVGVETAKTLATIWQKPLIPVNHLLGHFYANWINQSLAISHSSLASQKRTAKSEQPKFPVLGLLVSGGHTDLVLFTDHGKYEYLGGTRDDAAGECFDKCARLLGLPYPGGPNLSKLAEQGNPKAFKLPRPMTKGFLSKGQPSFGWDFSFSGLKTAVSNQINQIKSENQQTSESDSGQLIHRTADVPILSGTLTDLAASIEDAITDVLVEKTITAIQIHKVDQLIVAGGVAANKILAQKLTHRLSEFIPHAKIFIPPPSLCTDNAAYIATAAFFNYHPIDPLKLQANPNTSLS